MPCRAEIKVLRPCSGHRSCSAARRSTLTLWAKPRPQRTRESRHREAVEQGRGPHEKRGYFLFGNKSAFHIFQVRNQDLITAVIWPFLLTSPCLETSRAKINQFFKYFFEHKILAYSICHSHLKWINPVWSIWQTSKGEKMATGWEISEPTPQLRESFAKCIHVSIWSSQQPHEAQRENLSQLALYSSSYCKTLGSRFTDDLRNSRRIM